MSRSKRIDCGYSNAHNRRIVLEHGRCIPVECGLWPQWFGELGHFHDGQHQSIYFDRSDPWDDL